MKPHLVCWEHCRLFLTHQRVSVAAWVFDKQHFVRDPKLHSFVDTILTTVQWSGEKDILTVTLTVTLRRRIIICSKEYLPAIFQNTIMLSCSQYCLIFAS